MRDCYTPGSVIRPFPRPCRFVRPTRWNRVAAGLIAAGLLAFGASGHARAQASDQPPHYLMLGSAGLPLRLTLDKTYGQTRFAPGFGQLFLGYALPGGRYRHGFGAGVSWNLTHDGGFTDPLYAGDQFAVTPSYLGYYSLNTDVIALGHAGVPIVVRGGTAVGVEAGVALAYRVSAGAGVFGEFDLDAFGAGSFALLASLQVGLMIDYEVLP